MVEAEEDVLDAELEVSAGRLERARRRNDRERRRARRQPRGLRGAVEPFEANQDVSQGGAEAADGDRGSGQAVLSPDTPPLDRGIADEDRTRLARAFCAGRKLDMQGKARMSPIAGTFHSTS